MVPAEPWARSIRASQVNDTDTWCLTSTETIRLIRDGEKGERGMEVPGKMEIILSLQCHHQNDSVTPALRWQAHALTDSVTGIASKFLWTKKNICHCIAFLCSFIVCLFVVVVSVVHFRLFAFSTTAVFLCQCFCLSSESSHWRAAASVSASKLVLC